MRILSRSDAAALRSALACALLVVLVACAHAETETPVSDVDRLRALINETRVSRGLAPLVGNPVLDTSAREHAVKLARRQDLFHRSSREFRKLKVDWIRVGENVGTAGDVDEMHRHMLASPLHRANVLGPFTDVGIGIERDKRNRLWITELFVAQ